MNVKPVLRVEGKAFDVLNAAFNGYEIEHVIIKNEANEREHIYNQDGTFILNGCRTANFNEDLIWLGRYDPVENELDERIEENNKELVRLAVEHIEDDKLPFAEESRPTQYRALQSRTMGLIDAKDIIADMYIVEDVDLNGGDDDDEP